MYLRETLSFDQARRALEAMLAYVKERQLPPVAIAIVDDRGDLVYFVKMDGVSVNAGRMAINKAYTAAMIRRNTSDLKEVLIERNIQLRDYYVDDKLTTMEGGLVIPGGKSAVRSALGGIGVGGLTGAGDDDRLANVGLEAIKE